MLLSPIDDPKESPQSSSVTYSRFRAVLFQDLLDSNSQNRARALDNIVQIVTEWARVSSSLSQTVLSSSPIASSSYHFQNDPDVHFNRALPDKLSPLEERVAEVDEAARLLRHHILTILRFSVCCPYKDVKICLVGLLNELEVNPRLIFLPHTAMSSFVELALDDIYLLDSPENSRCPSPTLSAKDRCSSSSSLSTLPATVTGCLPPSVGCVPDEATKQIMTQTFANYGRTSNLFRIMAFFPSFWEKFESSQTCMMNGPGPIPKPWRCYVAIMAASQYNCQYMVSMMKLDYLTSGGDPTWLNGLQYTTQKIRNLAKLNGLMAHQPWRLKPRHIQELVCRETKHNPHNVWTISELAQVMVILSTVHSISMFVAACGIVPEIDMVGGTFVDFAKLQARKAQEEAMMSPLTMLPSPRLDQDACADSSQTGDAPSSEDSSLPAEEDPTRSPFHFHITLPPIPLSKKTYDEATSKLHTAELIKRLLLERETCCTEGEETMRPVQEDMSRFLDMTCQIEPALFDCRSSQYKVFRVDEFRWEDDASAVLSSLPELRESLEYEFSETLNFTDLSFFDENESRHDGGVDTFAFREAIWFYTLRLFGLLHQEYNYRCLSRFMNTTLAAYGQQFYLSDSNKVDKNDFDNMGFELRPEERCHVNIIVMEASKQAKLMYALRAVDGWERKGDGDDEEEDEGADDRY
ncbi:MAG: PA26 p53-induced protein-domain-containing protein [Linnemannia gamsii]|nr:MAG: PA26 p53-induced protein-domain-containing protein [Linnemannia gamsii]